MTEKLLETAVSAARAGGAILAERFRDASVRAEMKAPDDLVSEVDRESERAIVGIIRRAFPAHDILSEEAGWLSREGGEFRWLVDPLDGTSNFLQGLPIFAVSVACLRGEEPVAGVVFDPLSGHLFTAARGHGGHWNGRALRASRLPDAEGSFLATGYPFRSRGGLDVYLQVFRRVFDRARNLRRCGSAALDLAYTAAGVFDGFFEFRLSAWDVAAGALLVEEAGGRVTDLDGGGRYLETGNIVAGGPGVQPDLLRLVRQHADEALLDKLVPLVTAPR